MELLNNWKIILLGCLTLGLAPFYPEPHIWGKLQWLMGDPSAMKPADWFDLLLHGFPFLLLIRILVLRLVSKTKN